MRYGTGRPTTLSRSTLQSLIWRLLVVLSVSAHKQAVFRKLISTGSNYRHDLSTRPDVNSLPTDLKKRLDIRLPANSGSSEGGKYFLSSLP